MRQYIIWHSTLLCICLSHIGESRILAFVPSTIRHQSHGRVHFAPSTTHISMTFSEESMDVRTHPTPQLDGLQVVTLCMDGLQMKLPNEALEVCFNFSSDRCRAAVGGTLEQFVRYADNPVFGALVNCDNYTILSAGPVIPGASHGLGSRRGEMQTFLIEISEGMSMKTVKKGAEQRARKRPTIEERLRQRELTTKGESAAKGENSDDGKRKFLWTLQKEIRPPRQDCWLVHEVLFTKMAFQQTE